MLQAERRALTKEVIGEHAITVYPVTSQCLSPNHMLDVRPQSGKVNVPSLKGVLPANNEKHKRGTSKLDSDVKIDFLNEDDHEE